MILLYVIAVLLLVDLLVFINDKYILSFFMLVGTIAGAWYFVPEIANVIATYGWLELIGYYMGIGIAVATIKWFIANISLWLKLRDARQEYDTGRHSSNDTQTQAERHLDFARFWNNEYSHYGSALVPNVCCTPSSFFENSNHLVESLTLRAKDHIERIAFWILQWPLVVVATACEDLLINIGKNVARIFDYTFTQFSRRLVASTIKDL